MDALYRWCIGSDPGFKIVLRFVIDLIRQVIDIQVQVHPRPEWIL